MRDQGTEGSRGLAGWQAGEAGPGPGPEGLVHTFPRKARAEPVSPAPQLIVVT